MVYWASRTPGHLLLASTRASLSPLVRDPRKNPRVFLLSQGRLEAVEVMEADIRSHLGAR